jgi:UDPglucose 6-dehydrogenase
MKRKIAIVGHGFVGKAVDYGFSNPWLEKIIIDPKYNAGIDKLTNVDLEAFFICVPTPMNADGSINSKIVVDTVDFIKEYGGAGLIVIKSTVTPDVIKMLTSGPNGDIVIYNPEFLTEKAANEDFVNPNLHVFGGQPWACDRLYELYTKYSTCKPCPVYNMTAEEASFVKYGINSFLASKVLWMNQFYDIVEKHGSNYNAIINAVSGDPRIGTSHTSVPGFDGKRGFGGACFPKDTAAFLNFAEDFSVLREVINANNDYRSGYDLDDREKMQNITYVKGE